MAVFRGLVVDFDDVEHVASVRLDGSASEVTQGVAVSRGIAANEVVVGRRVLVDTGDHNHPGDFVVVAVW